MASTRRPDTALHDFKLGELVVLADAVEPFAIGDILQVIGFKGDTLIRLLPIGGLPVVADHELLTRTSLPSGLARPPKKRRRPRPRPRARAA